MVLCSLFAVANNSYAAPRATIRGSAGVRQSVSQPTATVEPEPVVTTATVVEPKQAEPDVSAVNKASKFDTVISSST